MIVDDTNSEKQRREISSQDHFYNAPYMVIDTSYEHDQSLYPNRNVVQYGHRVWGVWDGLVYEAEFDDQTIERIVAHRAKIELPVFVSGEKPYTMPNGESFSRTEEDEK